MADGIDDMAEIHENLLAATIPFQVGPIIRVKMAATESESAAMPRGFEQREQGTSTNVYWLEDAANNK